MKKYKLFWISLIIGLTYLLVIPKYIDIVHSDTKAYIEKSVNPFNAITISPGYPFLIKLAKLTKDWYLFMTLIQCVFFAGIMQMVYSLRKKWYVLGFILISGAYLVYIPYILSDLTFSFFVVAAYYFLAKDKIHLHVIMLMIASLIRPTLAYFFIIEPFIIWFRYKDWRLTLKMFVVVLLATSIVPLKNYILFDKFIHTTTLENQYNSYIDPAKSKILQLFYNYFISSVSTHWFETFRIFGYYKSDLVNLKANDFCMIIHYLFILFYIIIYPVFLYRCIRDKNYSDLLWVFYFQLSASLGPHSGRVRLPYEFLIY